MGQTNAKNSASSTRSASESPEPELIKPNLEGIDSIKGKITSDHARRVWASLVWFDTVEGLYGVAPPVGVVIMHSLCSRLVVSAMDEPGNILALIHPFQPTYLRVLSFRETTSFDWMMGLDSLKEFDANFSGMSQCAIDVISQLVSLRKVNIMGNKSVSDLKALTTAAAVCRLTSLNIAYMPIRDGMMEAIKEIATLRELIVHHCSDLKGAFRGIHKLAETLQILDATETGVGDEDVAEISTLLNLERLVLKGNTAITDVTPLKNCQCLKHLDICQTKVSACANYAMIGGLPQLTSLEIGQVHRGAVSGDEGYNGIVHSSTLRTLVCSNAPMSNTLLFDSAFVQALSIVHSLTSLDISFSSADLSPLASLTELRSLDVSHSPNLKDDTLKFLIDHLQKLRTLRIEGCKGVSAKALQDCEKWVPKGCVVHNGF